MRFEFCLHSLVIESIQQVGVRQCPEKARTTVIPVIRERGLVNTKAT